jgi:fructose-1,6-bisphosphatase
MEHGPDAPESLDLFWYLWSGPQSPLFGKDRITTFERDFVADARTHHEANSRLLMQRTIQKSREGERQHDLFPAMEAERHP